MKVFKKYYKMGQQEVINLLEKSNEWNTAEEITNKLKTNGRVVRRVLVLFRYNEIFRKKCKDSTHFKYIYKAK